jgi:mannose-6-phosphate isomerase
MNPIFLASNNFTPLKRTPWAGTKLAETIKSQFTSDPLTRIGESWELSCDPDAPSHALEDSQKTLVEIVSSRPEDYLSPEYVKKVSSTCNILIKLINPAQPLSFQIHPPDSHASLSQQECGKPESWYILDADPGAGIYLGFSREISIEELHVALESKGFAPSWLNFIPVKAGDYFEIQPGVPHAIGAGLVLLEPQRSLAGRRGVTWRMWDWDRRYANNGELDSLNGKQRTLNITDALSVLVSESLQGPSFCERLRRRPVSTGLKFGGTIKTYPKNNDYQLHIVQLNQNDSISILEEANFGGLTGLSGELTLTKPKTTYVKTAKEGQTIFLPFKSLPVNIRAMQSKATFAVVTPVIPSTAEKTMIIEQNE